MASGPNLPVPGAEVAPLTPGEGEGPVAGDVQPGAGTEGIVASEGSVAQPGVGEPGGPVAQPGEGAEGAPPASGEPRPGQGAEERIQGLVAKVASLETQLSDLEDVRDLADELDEVLVALRTAQPAQPQPGVTPQTPQPGQPAQPVPQTGVEGQIAKLTQTVEGLQGVVQKIITQPNEAEAYKAYEGIESKLFADAGITNPKEVTRVKEMINKEMDAGKHDWTRPRVAKRVIRGQIAEFKSLKTDLLESSVGPATPPAAPDTPPGTPEPTATVQAAPESPEVEPLDQAHQELGPLLEQMMKKGGGVI